MNYTPKQRMKVLSELTHFLQSVCHDPDCTKVKTCPHMCSCRNRRTFKTNDETGMCWEIAGQIFNYQRRYYRTVKDGNNLVIYTLAYANLSKYHMTKGWHNFFMSVYQIIRALFQQREFSNPKMTVEREFDYIRYILNRLKREPLPSKNPSHHTE